jgi:8-oxo-dGTP pyrophosphatase MutT (NUDIX family)
VTIEHTNGFEPTIVSRTEIPVSPWVRLLAKDVRFAPGDKAQTYHCLNVCGDYVAIFAETPSGQVPIVRQYRPAVEGYTWELPAGLLEPGEGREVCCRRELQEETGLIAQSVTYLGEYIADSGRLANRQHAFYVRTSEPDPQFIPEPGMTLRFVSRDELREMICRQEFNHMLHVGVVYLHELCKPPRCC